MPHWSIQIHHCILFPDSTPFHTSLEWGIFARLLVIEMKPFQRNAITL